MTRRLPPPDPAAFTPEQKAAHERLASLRRGGHSQASRQSVYASVGEKATRLEGPSSILLHSPVLSPVSSEFGLALRRESVVPTTAMEIAILTVAAAWKADYAFANHDAYAEKAGVPAPVIADLRAGRKPALTEVKDQLAWRVARAMLDARHVPDALQAEMRETLGDRGAVELTALVGYYGMLCGLCATFDIEVPDGRRVF
jgi:4-carboxymuconolactone decarboxylase